MQDITREVTRSDVTEVVSVLDGVSLLIFFDRGGIVFATERDREIHVIMGKRDRHFYSAAVRWSRGLREQ